MRSDVSLLDLGEVFGWPAAGVRRVGPAMRGHRRSAMTAVRRRGEWLAVTGARFAAGGVAAMAGLGRRDLALRFGRGNGLSGSRRTGGETGDGVRT